MNIFSLGQLLPVSTIHHSNMMDPARTHVKSAIIIPSKNKWAENTVIITLFVEGEVRTACVGGLVGVLCIVRASGASLEVVMPCVRECADLAHVHD